MSPRLDLNDGYSLPAIGLGLYKVPPEQTIATVTSGLTIGYRLLDGAAFYGNEAEVGQGLRIAEAELGIERGEVLVASKFWGDPVQSYDQALWDFDTTVGDLGLDYLDLYYIHWPRPSQNQFVQVWRALIRLRSEGRVRSIAVSNFNEHELTRLIDETGEAPSINQVESHPWLPQRELREFHRNHGIVTQAWSPLGRGRLLAEPTLIAIANKHDATTAQVILRWHRDLGGAAVPKSTDPERQRSNLAIDAISLDAEDMALLDTMASGLRTGTDPRDRA